jgi:branched-chain amino acid transport system substrate-binding protein
MNTFKKVVIGIVFIIIIVALTMLGQRGKSSTTNETVKVGVIAPLSGQYAVIGEGIRDAMLLNTKNEKGITFVFEDSQFDPKRAVSAYQKLTSVDNVDIIVNVDSPSLSSIQSLVDEDEILTFHLTESDSKKKDTVFQVMPFSYPIFGAIGKEASKKYDRVAVVYGSLGIFTTDAEYLKNEMAPNEIVQDVKISPNSDLRTEVSKILASNPDAVTVILDKDTGIKFLQILKQQKGDKKIDVICDANLEFVVGDYIKGVGADMLEGCISSNLPDIKQSFKDKFKQEFGYEPMIASDYSYDVVSIIKEIKKLPKDKWPEAVQKISFQGESGKISFDETGTRASEYVLKTFKDGKFVKLEN